jgi:hypothetical protein
VATLSASSNSKGGFDGSSRDPQAARSRIREAKARGWTLQQCADEWGLSRNAIRSVYVGEFDMIRWDTHALIMNGNMPPVPRPTDRSWMARAACRGMDTNLFYVDAGESYAPEAVAACEACPVKGPCLASADNDDYIGGAYRAGMTPSQRKRWRTNANKGEAA